MARTDALPTSLPPRGLSREIAAQYIGVSAGKFDELVRDHRMPPPKRIDGRKVWDRSALDEFFFALPDDREVARPADDPWDGAT